MRTLVIETATAACSVALFAGEPSGGALLAADHRLLGRGHAEALVPMVAALPDRGRAERILVDCGPGSFTGIRVGLAAARALALAWSAAVQGYRCHDLVAAIARARCGAGAVDVAMAGGHGEVFFCGFDAMGNEACPLASLSPERAAQRATAPVLAGSAAAEVAARLTGGRVQALALLPDARLIGTLDHARSTLPPMAIYGRDPDARRAGEDRVAP